MTTTRSPWFWIAISLAIIFAFLYLKSCKDTTNPTPNYKPELDSVQLVKSADSIRMKKRTDSLESLLQFADMREDIYRAQLGADGDKIKFLSSLIRNTKHDTIRTPYEIACDSLAIISPMYVSLVDSFARVVKGKDSIQDAIQLAWQERDSLTNLAYLSTVDIVVRAIETIEQMKPRAAVYIGVAGSGNLTGVSAGPSIGFTPRSGKWWVSGSYQFGNGRVVGVNYLRKISFGR